MPGEYQLSVTNDITILGAGIAGCATAIALKRDCSARRIHLIDKKSRHELMPCLQNAVPTPAVGETLPAQVMVPLQRLGLWELFLKMNNMPSSGTLSIWGENQPHANESIFSPYGHSWHIDRIRFNRLVLLEALKCGVELIAGTRLVSIENTVSGKQGFANGHELQKWSMVLKNSKPDGAQDRTANSAGYTRNSSVSNILNSRFLIDATGRSASLSKILGIHKKRYDSLMGIYRYYAPGGWQAALMNTHPDSCMIDNKRIDTTTLIESVQDGWWYCAALPGGQHVITLMADSEYIKRKNLKSIGNYNDALKQTRLINKRCGNLEPVTDPKVVAAYTQSLGRLSGRGWLAVGDAAFTFDPLSSLGIFKALRMSILAAFAVKDYFSGHDQCLQKYQWLGRSEFDAYLQKRRDYYEQENRFTNHEFWQRRKAA